MTKRRPARGRGQRRCSREPHAHTRAALRCRTYPTAPSSRPHVRTHARSGLAASIGSTCPLPLPAGTQCRRGQGNDRVSAAQGRRCVLRRVAWPGLASQQRYRPTSGLWRGKQGQPASQQPRRPRMAASKLPPPCALCLCASPPAPAPRSGRGARRPVPCPARHRSRWETESARRAGRAAAEARRGGPLRARRPAQHAPGWAACPRALAVGAVRGGPAFGGHAVRQGSPPSSSVVLASATRGCLSGGVVTRESQTLPATRRPAGTTLGAGDRTLCEAA